MLSHEVILDEHHHEEVTPKLGVKDFCHFLLWGDPSSWSTRSLRYTFIND
jgi:hypothetical protein